MAEPLKQLINAEAVAFLAIVLERQFSSFDKSQFQQQVLAELASLTLTQRVNLIADVITSQLPEDFSKVAPPLLTLAENWPVSENTGGWQNYTAWPLISYAGRAGLKTPDMGLTVLAAFTPLFTAEFAIRPYLEQHFESTYQQMLLWTQNTDPHLRRLASEGLRPRLPWGKHLSHIPLKKALALLEQLKDDDSVYVQKSVANHLNDLSKEHPQQILDLCQRWQNNATPARQWIIRRALRTLQKQADPSTMALLGYRADLPLNTTFQLTETECRIGDAVTLQLTIQNLSSQPQSLLIDYELGLMRANGTLTTKVFFWQRLLLASKQKISVAKQQKMQQLSTRKLYPGEHSIVLRINGQLQARQSFQLRP
ncbi:MAG TPA: DNA alkylation repair protein [Methylophaga sp.]|nr:DNA alkylation repair protein [Methylophaga sp.]